MNMNGKGKTPVEMHARLASRRVMLAKKKGVKKRNLKGLGPDLTNVRLFLKGQTHHRGVVETRGAKKKLTRRQLQKVDTIRKKVYAKADGEREVHWAEILDKAGLEGVVDVTTLAKNMKEAGYDVEARRPREKPCRTDEHDEERVRVCKAWDKKPENFFTKKVHIVMDNKVWDVATTKRARRFKNMSKVRFHLRKRKEGLKRGFTKPGGTKKHRINPGASVSVLAGVVGGRIRIWHYLPKKRWNGKVAAACYEGPIIKALRRCFGPKKEYLILEDNDPTGYQSNAAKAAKTKLSIKRVPFPRYSPDLMPLDFALWDEIERRMSKRVYKNESVEHYKKRLRRTALAVPAKVVGKTLKAILPRARAVIKECGGHIAMD